MQLGHSGTFADINRDGERGSLTLTLLCFLLCFAPRYVCGHSGTFADVNRDGLFKPCFVFCFALLHHTVCQSTWVDREHLRTLTKMERGGLSHFALFCHRFVNQLGWNGTFADINRDGETGPS